MKKHLSAAQKKQYKYYLSLVSSVLNGTAVQTPYENCSFELMKQISRDTRTDAVFDEAVIMLSKTCEVPDDMLSFARYNLNHHIYIDTLMNFEIESILRAFDKNKIFNLPMKGYFLKKDYPNPFERSISDYDILFDINDIEKIKSVFKGLGYDFVKKDDQQYHFQKKPFMYIEMHQSLVKKSDKNYSFFENQLDTAKIRDGYSYSKEMSFEDYYVYMLIHSAKHFSEGGIGVRMLADEYVFYKKYAETLDWSYLNSRLKECGIDVYEKRIRDISLKWFTPENKISDFDDVEEYIIMSMALGRTDVAVMSGMEKQRVDEKTGKKRSKFSSLITSLFPNKQYMAERYPFVNKAPVFLPYSWLCMWCRRAFIDKDLDIKKGFKNRTSYTDDDVRYFNHIQNEVGFGNK